MKKMLIILSALALSTAALAAKSDDAIQSMPSSDKMAVANASSTQSAEGMAQDATKPAAKKPHQVKKHTAHKQHHNKPAHKTVKTAQADTSNGVDKMELNSAKSPEGMSAQPSNE